MFSPLARQIFVASATQLASLSSGGVVGFPTVLLQQFKSNESEIHVDMDTSTWIASVHGLAGIPSLFMPAIMQLKGRKFAFNMSCILIIIGWIIATMAESARTIIIAESFHGLGIKSIMVSSYLSISEMVDPKHRNLFLNCYGVGHVLGLTMVHLLGRFFHWRTISMIMNGPIVLALIIGCCWPESPSWLAYKLKFEECDKAFVWLRGKNEDAQKELRELMNSQRLLSEDKEDKLLENKSRNSNLLKDLYERVTARDFYLPSLLVFVVLTIYYWSGNVVLLMYATDLLIQATNNEDAAFLGMVVFDGVTVVGVLLSWWLLKYFNNKPVLMLSSLTSVLFLIGACICTYLQTIGYIGKDSFLCIYFLVGFMGASSLGIYSIPFSITAELMPVKHRGLGGGIIVIIISLLYTSSLKLSPYLFLYINLYGTFLVYICIVIVCLIIVLLYLPETKNRTLQEIEDYYNNGCFADSLDPKMDPNVKVPIVKLDQDDDDDNDYNT